MSKKPLAVEITHEAQWLGQNNSRINFLQLGIDRNIKFKKLQENPLFKELITELYIKQEAANLVHLMSDPEFNSADQQNSIQRRLGGISSLQNFMLQYMQAGSTAEAEVAQLMSINKSLEQGMMVPQILAELEAVNQQMAQG
jgi:hypothetical protein